MICLYKLNTGGDTPAVQKPSQTTEIPCTDIMRTKYIYVYIYYTLIVHAKQSKPDCLVSHLKNGYLPMKLLQQLNLQLQDLTNRAYYSGSKLQIQRNCL